MSARVRAQGPSRKPREGLCQVGTVVLHRPRDPEASLRGGLAMAFLFAGNVANTIRPHPPKACLEMLPLCDPEQVAFYLIRPHFSHL